MQNFCQLFLASEAKMRNIRIPGPALASVHRDAFDLLDFA